MTLLSENPASEEENHVFNMLRYYLVVIVVLHERDVKLDCVHRPVESL